MSVHSLQSNRVEIEIRKIPSSASQQLMSLARLSELAASTLAGFAQLASTSTLPEPTISVTRCSNCATENTTLWRRSAETGAT